MTKISSHDDEMNTKMQSEMVVDVGYFVSKNKIVEKKETYRRTVAPGVIMQEKAVHYASQVEPKFAFE